MTEPEWFRRHTWNDADQEHFFQKLKRARAGGRGQYLRIQAYHLQEVKLFREAITLLDMMVSEYPNEIQLASAWTQMAECKRAVGDIDGAVVAYRAAIAQMRVRANVKTSAFQDYPLMVGMLRLETLFAEANEILKNEGSESIFAVGRFKIHAAQALILDCSRDVDRARSEALNALEYAEIKKSGITYHQDIGLVGKQHIEVLKRLMEIVGTQ